MVVGVVNSRESLMVQQLKGRRNGGQMQLRENNEKCLKHTRDFLRALCFRRASEGKILKGFGNEVTICYR